MGIIEQEQRQSIPITEQMQLVKEVIDKLKQFEYLQDLPLYINTIEANKDCASFYILDSSAKDRVFVDGTYEAHIPFRLVIQRLEATDTLEEMDLLNKIGFFLEALDRVEKKDYTITKVEQTSIPITYKRAQDGSVCVSAEYKINYERIK